MDENGIVEIKDFSRKGGTTPKQFTADGDTFYMVPGVPLGRLAQVAKLGSAIGADLTDAESADKAISTIVSLFASFLLPESLELFSARLSDPENPIELPQIIDMIPWLLETYGLRPTKPSPGSSSTSPVTDDSTNSTAGAAPTIAWPGLISTPAEPST